MTNYQKRRDEAADKSVNRNMLELIEADARVRHFKLGADWSRNHTLADVKPLALLLNKVLKFTKDVQLEKNLEVYSLHEKIHEELIKYMELTKPDKAME